VTNLPKNLKQLRLLVLILSLAFLGRCGDKAPDPSFSIRKPNAVTFSKSWEANIGFPDSLNAVIKRVNGNLVANAPTHNGNLQSVSEDNGRSWSHPILLNLCDRPVFPVAYRDQSLWYLSREQVPDGGQFYVHTPNKNGWNPPTPLRDTYWGQCGGFQFAFDSLGGAYAVFGDYREGNPDVYFSFSLDTGKTWSPNVRINDDHTGQEQLEPVIAASPSGRLCILWADNRNSRTLFDIYCSTSSDRGKTWSHNIKVNDDTTHTWQGTPSLIYSGKNFCGAWMDYRDVGASGDIRSNIYFASSEGNGTTWSPSIRISENSLGNSTYPNLYKTGTQMLGCLWMDSGENILDDIFYACSPDRGASWSVPMKVNDDTTRTSHYHRGIGWLGAGHDGENVVGWLDARTGKRRARLATLVAASDSLPTRKIQSPVASEIPLPAPFMYRATMQLFRDKFAADPSSQWRVLSGTWVWKNDMYAGYGARTTCSVTGDESWSDYEFSGQFKLDELDHRAAYLYLRFSDNPARRYYRITNFFRKGITLEHFDGERSTLMAEVPYPIRKEPWYRFKAVVKGSALNYFLNDTLRISFAKLVHLQRGKVGIGSETVPTYFKDIAVNKVE
jgi:hypothetical protein